MSDENPSPAGTAHNCICLGAGPALTAILKQLTPSEPVMEHFRNARIEFLKGIRQMIDQRIDQLSRTEEKGAKITVE